MTVSPICVKDGHRYAYVSFTDGKRSAEGKIPECKIVSSTGFTENEVEQLETYMRNELAELKRIASGINVMDAFMK